jgi:hypothetical protein
MLLLRTKIIRPVRQQPTAMADPDASWFPRCKRA